MSDLVSIEDFLHDELGPLFDVRAPVEYSHGHIPGSVSLPLFSDEGRASVGTTYKQKGHDAAVLLGLELVGPTLARLAKEVHAQMASCTAKVCRVTCFRGGMRSRSVQWLCQFLGYKTTRLDGGYKAFRRRVLESFSRLFSFIVLGGPTGSGKTDLLKGLKEQGQQVVDLEALACHRGSAFGLAPHTRQPSNEQFENLLASELWRLDPKRPVFVEDESRMIGSCVIPKELYEQLDRARLLWLDVPYEERVRHILDGYGSQPRDWLLSCVGKLQKRLGSVRVQQASSFIQEGQLEEAVHLLLHYYDQAYLHSRSRHDRPVVSVGPTVAEVVEKGLL